MKVQPFFTRLEPEVLTRIRKHCKGNKLKIQELVNRVLKSYISKNKIK